MPTFNVFRNGVRVERVANNPTLPPLKFEVEIPVDEFHKIMNDLQTLQLHMEAGRFSLHHLVNLLVAFKDNGP